MRRSSEGSRGHGLKRRARLFMTAALLACAGFAVNAGAAQAVEEKFTFDEARINLGDNKGVPLIDPSIPDPHATLTGDLDPATGEFTAPATGLAFPNKTLENFSTGPPFNLIVDALVEFDAITPIAGNYDPDTGELAITDMDLTVLLTVYLDGTTPEDALGICRVEPVPLPIETTGEIVDDDGDPPTPVTFSADPFDPPAREGAAVTTWATLPASTQEGGTLPGTVCPAIDDLLGGPGGIWLSGVDGEIDPPPPPPPPPPTPPGGTPVPPGPASLTLDVSGKKKTKAGKKANFTADVSNIGESAAQGVEVCAKAPKKKAKVKGDACQAMGSLGAGNATSSKFKLKTKKKAKGKAQIKFTASADGLSDVKDKTKLKIKKKRKK